MRITLRLNKRKVIFGAVVIIASGLFFRFIKIVRVSTNSMSEFIKPGDFVMIIKKNSFVSFSDVFLSDVIIFNSNFDESSSLFIKRICALGGDTLFAKEKALEIHNKEYPHDRVFNILSEEVDSGNPDSLNPTQYFKHLIKASSLDSSKIMFSEKFMIVPEGHYFMIGDNY